MSTARQWLIRLLGGTVKTCNHKWFVLIEHYPTYAQDYWKCEQCKFTKAYQHDNPPEPLETEICNLGHIHVVNGRDVKRLQFIYRPVQPRQVRDQS